MSPVTYRDLLWDFVYESTSRGRGVMLRLFANENEMYERGLSPTTFTVTLPIEWYSGTKRGRSEWPNSSIPAQELVGLGQQLWSALPLEVKEPLLAATPDQPCRLKISSNSAAIDDLPWEWLNDGSSPPFALQPACRVVRSVPIRLAIPPITVVPPIRVLLVLTNPKDEVLLNSWQEINAVSQRLNTHPYALTVLSEPTYEALTAALRDEPHILHYIGHAGIDRGEGNIILHDEYNHTHWISAAALAQALPPGLKLLCLSTCFTAPNYQILGLTRLAHVSAQHRLPTTVTNLYPVQESSVQQFWNAFYSSLVLHHGNANDAFHDGQATFANNYNTQADWGSFSLVIREQTGEVMRLQDSGTRSAGTYEAEIQAQFSSRLANDLAEIVSKAGDAAPESVRTQAEEESGKASDLTKSLYEEESP